MESLNERQKLFILPENSGALYNLKKNKDDTYTTFQSKLISKKQVTHDSYIFSFELQDDMHLGLNLGQHVAFEQILPTEENPQGELISRKYTPISHILEKGKFDILIKIYHKGINFEHISGGVMTQWLDKLEIGSELTVRGPIGRLFYYGDGKFRLGTKEKPIKWTTKTYNKVGMLCGGTGITPLYQILQAADMNKDSVEFSLIFGNRSQRDIFLKEELDKLQKNQNIKFNLQYTIDKEEEGWNGLTGYINKDKIEKYLPGPTDDTLIILCGRGKMCKKYLTPILLEIGHKPENIHIF